MTRAAYQGEPGAFSQTAAFALLGEEVTTIPFRSFEEMFDSIAGGTTDCCVAPIENSLAGSIHRNYDLLLASGLEIFGEINLRVVHNLIAAPGARLDGIRRVYSHPVALAQCGRFLRRHSQLESVPVHDTAGAVRLVMDRGLMDEAAIASEVAAKIYGGVILAQAVEDDPQNYTRFFLLALPQSAIRRVQKEGRWKTSLLLEVKNTPGSLVRALSVLAAAGIDMSKIESRPIPGKPWEYAFYVDIIGNAAEAAIAPALDDLSAACDSIRMLGSYQSG